MRRSVTGSAFGAGPRRITPVPDLTAPNPVRAPIEIDFSERLSDRRLLLAVEVRGMQFENVATDALAFAFMVAFYVYFAVFF